MPDWWAWAACGGNFTLTIGKTVAAKTACNAVLPGSSALYDFFLAGKCLYYGDMIGAASNTASGIVDVISCGTVGAIKDAMNGSAKTAATEAAKETAKSASKEATSELSKQLAKGAIKGGKDAAIDAAKMAAKSASKEAAKKVGQQFGKELAQGVVTETVEEVFHQGTKITLKNAPIRIFLGSVFSDQILTQTLYETTKQPQKFAFTEAAKKGAEEVFKKQSYKLLVKDVACASLNFLKEAISYNSSDRD